MDLLGEFLAAFGSYGFEGMLLALFLVVVLDAMVIPLGPELLAIAIFSTSVGAWQGAFIVAAVMAGQVTGTTMLYVIGRHPRVMPRRIKRLMVRYKSALIIRDERIVFVNCFVPVLPFLGAFVAVSGWDYRKSMALVMLGGGIKYSLFLGLSGSFHYLFETGVAQKASLLAVLALLVASGVYAFKRRDIYRSAVRVEEEESAIGRKKSDAREADG